MQILLHLYLCPQNPTHGLCPHGLCPKVEDTTHVSPLRSLSVIVFEIREHSGRLGGGLGEFFPAFHFEFLHDRMALGREPWCPI